MLGYGSLTFLGLYFHQTLVPKLCSGCLDILKFHFLSPWTSRTTQNSASIFSLAHKPLPGAQELHTQILLSTKSRQRTKWEKAVTVVTHPRFSFSSPRPRALDPHCLSSSVVPLKLYCFLSSFETLPSRKHLPSESSSIMLQILILNSFLNICHEMNTLLSFY